MYLLTSYNTEDLLQYSLQYCRRSRGRSLHLVKFHLNICISTVSELEERSKTALSIDFCGSNSRKTVQEAFQYLNLAC